VWQDVWAQGRDPRGEHFVQAYGAEAMDAALLQFSTMGLPVDVQTLRRTRLAVERDLRRGALLQRYRIPDGIAGDEGAFLVCSFWHVDSLLAEGEEGAARELFERLVGLANDVGLYSEQVDADAGGFLGNFPQAFT